MNIKKLKACVKYVFPTARELLVRDSVRSNTPYSYKKVLVIGAGNDPFRAYFSDASLYVCLDIEKEENITDLLGDAHVLPFGGCSFDAVVLIEVLEHLRSPVLCIQEIFRVLNNGGELILSVPFMFHEHAHPSDYVRFTEHGLHELLKDFDSVDIVLQGNRLHVISDLVTTSFYPLKLMLVFRCINWLWFLDFWKTKASTAPSGFFVKAIKKE